MPAESFEEEGLERIPDLRLSQWLFQASLSRTSTKSKSLLVNSIMDVIKSESAFLSTLIVFILTFSHYIF